MSHHHATHCNPKTIQTFPFQHRTNYSNGLRNQKKRYPTREAAQRALESIIRGAVMTLDPLCVYQYKYSTHYHLGHISKAAPLRTEWDRHQQSLAWLKR